MFRYPAITTDRSITCVSLGNGLTVNCSILQKPVEASAKRAVEHRMEIIMRTGRLNYNRSGNVATLAVVSISRLF